MNLRKIVAINLKYFRYKAKKSQEKFYNVDGLNAKYMSSIERGDLNFTIDFIENAAKILCIPVNELFNFDERRIIKRKRIDSKV